MQKHISQLTNNIGYSFVDKTLLERALTHRSFGVIHNERLEFLGDAILSSVISTAIFHRFPNATEGELTRMRAHLVCGKTLSELAQKLQLGEYITFGLGEQRSGGYRRQSILAGTLEALIGAIFLDTGMQTAEHCILQWYHDRFENIEIQPKDPKTKLQEWVQKDIKALPEYPVTQIERLGCNQIFHVHCQVPESGQQATGKGSNRRLAEQAAAEKVLEILENAR